MSTEVTVAERPMCDLCKYLLNVPTTPALYDGATIDGPWAYMCEVHFQARGVGLGTGRGQRLVLKEASE